MSITRRKFIQQTAITVAGIALLSRTSFAMGKANTLTGVQLYSVREEMNKDALGTLKQVAKMGYRHVEHANYIDRKFYGYGAKEFKKILDDLALKMPSGHTVLNGTHWDETKKDFTDKWKYTIEDAAVLQQQFVISPSLPEEWRKEQDTLKRYMDVFNKSGELCRKSGMKFGYHNHDFEFREKFSDGTTVYDVILQNTDPNLVMQQLDIGNMFSGGGKALDIIQKYPGRFPSLHVKDEIAAPGSEHGYESALLGTGIIGVKEVLEQSIKSGGAIHLIIEQESYQGKSPLQSIQENLKIMQKWGY
ncbi:MAG: sugar phosphate isomerase/epimerase [Chitinophagaceae bacterium]|nr:MAG: sugar phosphate isomerase/epimerase [Chitinophagaceae bacterium]